MNELSVSQRKQLASLTTSKGRKATGLFIVEGLRAVGEMNAAMPGAMRDIIATPAWWDEHGDFPLSPHVTAFSAKNIDIDRISSLSTPQPVIATFAIPDRLLPGIGEISSQLTVALDSVQDPGNLGTIIRLCDWWGVRHLFCSHGTVDCYSPKVVQASMGALGRVEVHHVDLPSLVGSAASRGVPVCGTFMQGDDILHSPLPCNGAMLILGNEGNGISPAVETAVTRRLTIPSYAPADHVESLNVATACAICLAMFRCNSTI